MISMAEISSEGDKKVDDAMTKALEAITNAKKPEPSVQADTVDSLIKSITAGKCDSKEESESKEKALDSAQEAMKQLSIAHLDNNRSALEQHKKLMNHMMQ